MGKLEGKIALVTGGNSGIGLATAKEFVGEGAFVFITGRRDPELASAVKEIGNKVTAVRGDVSKLGDLDRLFAQVKQEKGRLDVVFANAGIAQLAPLEKITEQHFEAIFGNVKGVVFTVQKALPLLPDGASVIGREHFARPGRRPTGPHLGQGRGGETRAMRAESFTGYGGLKLAEVPRPTLADGRVLVRITAAGVSPLDHTILSGGYPRATAPLILGNEGAGVVENPGDSSFSVGARVMFCGPYGYQRQLCRRHQRPLRCDKPIPG